jgi:hypothetical protein
MTVENAEAVFEFPVPVDRASYFLPTVGMVVIGSIVAAISLMVAAMTLPGIELLERLIPAALRDIVVFGMIAGAGALAGVWWVRRRVRIHSERKLVLHARGITYHAYSGRQRLMPWDDMARVVETADRYDECQSLRFHMASSSFDVGADDFVGYDLIKFIVLNRLPEITATVVSVPEGIDRQTVARALRQWGHPKGAHSLLLRSH